MVSEPHTLQCLVISDAQRAQRMTVTFQNT